MRRRSYHTKIYHRQLTIMSSKQSFEGLCNPRQTYDELVGAHMLCSSCDDGSKWLPCRSRGEGLQSGLELPNELKDFWFPVAFSSQIKGDEMVAMELFGEPWVMFRDAQGLAACVKDACAHRACPLSLVRVSAQPQTTIQKGDTDTTEGA